MKVTLIDYTKNATDKLLYTKATRLTQGADTRAKIAAMTPEEKAQELAYMATTIPSSWEFVNYTFEILGVTRAFTHQLVRTRAGSYAQQTMRMLPMEEFTYETGPTIADYPAKKALYDDVMMRIQAGYDTLIQAGCAIEDARGILPTNIHTNIIAQFSLRTLAEMARSRGGKRTQGEYRAVLEYMINCVIMVHPWAIDFLQPDKFKPITEIERLVEELKSDDSLFNKSSMALNIHKQLDQLRKSL